MRNIVLVAHNLRSCHNIGSLLRTAEGLGVQKVYLTGYTPYPKMNNDDRLPHIAEKIDKQIHKTALGSEKLIAWEHREDISSLIEALLVENYVVCALEQDKNSIKLPGYKPPRKMALLVGNEVTGLDSQLMSQCSCVIEIPMLGKKESFNVVQATAMALYHLTLL